MQVEADLEAANGKFLQLHGPAGGAELDLYGRAATLYPHEKATSRTSRADSFKDGRHASKTGRLRSSSFKQQALFELLQNFPMLDFTSGPSAV